MRSLLLSLVMLAACAPPQVPPAENNGPSTPAASPQDAEEATAEDTCGAARFQHLIGALASAIDRAALPAGTRIVAPDSIVTQDFSPQRLNIITGTDGRVSSLACF